MTDEHLLLGSCHCGAVRLTLPSAPEKATKCNCSLCRRLGGLWAYYEFGTVRVDGHPENTAEYVWSDKTLRTVRCKTCGCAPIGSHSRRNPVASTASTSTTLIRVFKSLFRYAGSMARTLGHS